MKYASLKIPYTIYRKLYEKKDKDGFGNKSLEEYLAYLVKNVKLKPTLLDNVQETTRILLDIWMENFSNNLPYIRFGDDVKITVNSYSANNLAELAEQEVPTFEKSPKGSAIVIGRGPSIFKRKHLDLLAKSNYKGVIVSTDGMLINCLKHKIIPNLTTTVDGSEIIKKWYDHPLVRKYGPQLNVALNATTNHKVYQLLRKAKCKVYWFYPLFDDYRQVESWTRMQRLMTISKYNPKPLQTLSAGGNTGTCAWVMATDLFKRSPVALIGIDFSYPEGTKLEETPYFSSVMNSANGDVGAIPFAYKQIYHPIFKTKALIDAVFEHYKRSFIAHNLRAPQWYHYHGGTLNCSEGGALWGPKIKCLPFQEFLNCHDH